MLMRSFHKPITTAFCLFALSLLSQSPLAAQSMEDAAPTAPASQAIAQWQLLQIPNHPLDSTTNTPRQDLNLADQIPPVQIFIPPPRPTQGTPELPRLQEIQDTQPSFASNKPTTSSSYGDRPSLSDVMRVQPAPLPYFIYETSNP
jgi:hypothetical protein